MNAYRCWTCKERLLYRRGCCKVCYRLHRLRIAAGEESWVQLEAAGLAKPRQTKAERDLFHQRVALGQQT